MQIQNTTERPCIRFSALSPGDVFIFNDKVYIRIGTTKENYSAVQLDYGVPICIVAGEKVTQLPDATLTYAL